MRKQFIPLTPETARPHGEGWLDLERAAVVEVTSEEENFPVESALVSGETRGWCAAIPGTQTIRLVFDQPQRLRRIALVFEEHETTRTQEFVLRASSDGGRSFREIVRQQWNFSPPQTVRELQAYEVELSDITVLELITFSFSRFTNARCPYPRRQRTRASTRLRATWWARWTIRENSPASSPFCKQPVTVSVWLADLVLSCFGVSFFGAF